MPLVAAEVGLAWIVDAFAVAVGVGVGKPVAVVDTTGALAAEGFVVGDDTGVCVGLGVVLGATVRVGVVATLGAGGSPPGTCVVVGGG